jgi:hypothetical protein
MAKTKEYIDVVDVIEQSTKSRSYKLDENGQYVVDVYNVPTRNEED